MTIKYVYGAIIFLHIISISGATRKKRINIGVFLSENSTLSEIALQSAINRINLYSKTTYNVTPFIYKYPDHDIFQTGKIVCDLLEKGVAAIFGPEATEINEIIQSVSSFLEIPQYQIAWNSRLTSFSSQALPEKPVQVFNLYPNPYMVGKALSTLVRENDWDGYIVIYENDDGLIRLQEVLKTKDPNGTPLTFKKLGPGPDYRTVLKEVKASEAVQIILDCESSHIFDILSQASDIKLLEEYHSYILTSLDTHTLDLSSIPIKANITAFRLVDPSGNSLQDVVRDWELAESYQERYVSIESKQVETRTALLYDAINLFITAFSELDTTEDMFITPLKCDEDEVSLHGFRLNTYTAVKTFNDGMLPGPLTGPIRFDPYGQRSLFKLQIIELSKEKDAYRLTGTWDSRAPHVIFTNLSLADREKEKAQQLQGKNFRVVARTGEPYLMRRVSEDGTRFYGNNRYEGYAMDLIHEICVVLNCSYTFEVVPDNNYGTYDHKTKKWNGLIKHLLDRKADLAVCDLTITYERRKAVDFTMPFMTLGVSILYAKAVKPPPELLSFTNPLSLDVWLYMATAFLVMSILIYMVARLNPKEWENPHPCNPNPTELENIWNFKNCCWLTLGSIMAQGCDILPKSISTRMIAGMWWFFSLIMTASYTANLAAFLTMERMGPTIESAEDMAAQTKIKYGCVTGGATSSFFKESNFSTYHRMWVQMESADPNVFEKNNQDGVKRVVTSKRKYAFIMESSAIEYEMERNCDLMQVGNWLDSKGYGIAMPTNFQYRTSINQAILKLQEMGTLRALKNRWWKEKNGGGKCEEDKSTADATATEMGLANVGGVFVVLAGGIAIALIIAICEFLWNVRNVAVTEQMTFREAFDIEIKFVLDIWARKKAVKRSNEESEKVSNKSSCVELS